MNDYLLIAIIFYFSIVLHECLHVIGYKICRLNIKRFYIFPFDFVFDDSFKVGFAFEKNCVGLVIPQNNNEYTVKQLRRKTIVGLATPVVGHLILSVAGGIAYFLFDIDIYLNVSLVNILCVFSTFICNENVFGDSIALYHIFIFDELSQKILNGIYDRMLYNNKE